MINTWFTEYPIAMTKLLTTTEFGAACKPPMTSGRVVQLIASGDIKAIQLGRTYGIEQSELKKFADKRVGPGWKKGRKRS